MSPDTRYEPRLALFGGKTTGFEMYERLFREVEELQTLIPDTQITLLCEFGFDQRDIAETVLQQYPKWDSIFFADYAGIERFVEIAIHK
jgi:methylase of polypeptide subunit release factors